MEKEKCEYENHSEKEEEREGKDLQSDNSSN